MTEIREMMDDFHFCENLNSIMDLQVFEINLNSA